MKITLVLLSLAVVAVSNAAVLNGPGRFGMVVGNIGPNDSKLTTMNSVYNPVEGITLHWAEIGFSMPTVQLTIAYIQIVEKYSSGATAEIVSGGVGSDHVKIRFTPHNNQAYDFNVEVYGSYITNEKSGALPEIVTFETKATSPSE